MRRFLFLVCLVACGSRFRGDTVYDKDPPKNVLELAARPLTAGEKRKLDDRGFVILGNGSTQSFHVGYTALFHAHQPVFITADSLLYAWHSSYDKVLIDLELRELAPALGAMLEDVRGALARSDADAETRADLDVYITVAASLLAGKQLAPSAGGDPALIGAMFEKGTKAEGEGIELFGKNAKFDYTMLKPRGHYTTMPQLQQYFRAMSWLGRAEIQLATKLALAQHWSVNRRALRSALLLASLFGDKTRQRWQTIDSTIGALVGPADSMSLPGLAKAAAGLPAIDKLSDDQIVAAFEAPSAQKIRTQLAHAGDRSIAFLLLGQRFIFDSGVLSDLTWGSLATDPPRLMPTPLDVAHVVMHNPAARTLLASEVKRYGAPYEQALARGAATPLPTDSVTHLWLNALRELSPDAKRDAKLPAPLTSEHWSRRMMLAQLASWAELRHDNLLYAKQSFTAELGCEFPDAYIDPYPAFYATMEAMAMRAHDVVALPRAKTYFAGMAKTMARLRAIADRERANQPLTADDLDFINHMVSLDGKNGGCAPTTDPKGWYAELFYEQKIALWHDPVIADVHTQPTDLAGNPVGRVLHVATGNPHMMALTIRHDGGANTQTYRGFVSTYAELITEKFQRLTDEEWRARIAKQMTGTPRWVEDLVGR